MRKTTAIAARRLLVLAFAGALSAAPASADQFINIGARQRGMGSAGVAGTEDSTSVYWNAGNLAFTPLNRPPLYGRDWANSDTGTATPTVNKSDRWDGYDTVMVDLSIDGGILLTGDIVHQFDLLRTSATQVQASVQRLQSSPATISKQDVENVMAFVNDLYGLNNSGDGISYIAGGLFARYKWAGLGIYSNTYGSIRPHVDLTTGTGLSSTGNPNVIAGQIDPGGNIKPTTQAGQQMQSDLVAGGLTAQAAATYAGIAEQGGQAIGSPAVRGALEHVILSSGQGQSLFNNTSGGGITTVSVEEIALSLAPIYLDFDSVKIGLGVTPKAMLGETYQDDITVAGVLLGNQSFKDVLNTFEGSRTETWQFGIDVGATIELGDAVRIGCVGRDLNSPRFKLHDGSEAILRPQVRLGVAVRPVESITFSTDVDLIKNESIVTPGLQSQQVALGFEWAPMWEWGGIALRLGMNYDVDSPWHGFNPQLCAGFGVKVAFFYADLGASLVPETETYNGTQIPRVLGLSATFGFHF
jgi:hypothetical protein